MKNLLTELFCTENNVTLIMYAVKIKVTQMNANQQYLENKNSKETLEVKLTCRN